jgi:flavin reductase (DIM6/NTAB) family NADH-FMN oxidoreductase RutF
MFFDTAALDWKSGYKLLSATVTPRPIAWVVSRNPDGSSNAAPFSFFNYFSGYPPVICLGMTLRPQGPCDTLVNIEREGAFVINLVSDELAQAMNTTAIEFPPGESEVAAAGLRVLPCERVPVPRIADSPVSLECRLAQVIDISGASLILGHVVGLHITDEAVLDADRCYVDAARLRVVGRMESPGAYVHTSSRFHMDTPSLQAWRTASTAAAGSSQS